MSESWPADGSDSDSAPQGRILYLDANPKTAKLTATGLRLAGYTVDAVTTLSAANAALASSARGSSPLGVVLVDACHNAGDAAALVEAVEASSAGAGGLPVVILCHRDLPTPFPAAERHACLKRPFATPSLVSLVRHIIGAPQINVTETQVAATSAVTTVGGYELIAEIARGGMGTVYLCRKSGEAGFRRLYAMKVLHPHLAEQTSFVTMLVDEARLAARLHHPNVAAVVDLGHDEAGPFIVMEYVEGVSLYQLTKAMPDARPVGVLVSIFIEVLEGLHAAHELTDDAGRPLHLVHRDVSPQNILVGVDGRARLVDFGVAKARARISVTKDGVLKGKLAYLAPEMLSDDERIDHRADLFSLGAVMWSALTGRRLFLGESEAKTILNIIEKEVPPPSTVGQQPPAALDAVILRALSKHPEDRFETAQEMANELRRVAQQESLLAPPSAVGSWVREGFGPQLAERRMAVRLAQTVLAGDESLEHTEVTPISMGGNSNTVSSHEHVGTEPQRGRTVSWIGGVVGVLGLVGGMAIVMMRGPSEPTPAERPTAPGLASPSDSPTPKTDHPSPPAPPQSAEGSEVDRDVAPPKPASIASDDAEGAADPEEDQASPESPAAAPAKLPPRPTARRPRKPPKRKAKDEPVATTPAPPAPAPPITPIEQNPYR